ncbi:branched-chain amino acid ABC transporter permease [Peptoniphilus equinus]|uniref:Branched-chain amino acid ABC transporter permease n=1 Tax=Peptoniphilus equinus TaxID=3016343 RepID=A0ABY7QUQ1_9FIRM|nr:branched-chain amino acid ABC transporter permease [Peptoniphilus equinus]WBW50510.1 branched-chain amino acid ABC transporter permease [Peptoniphilus equinus]
MKRLKKQSYIFSAVLIVALFVLVTLISTTVFKRYHNQLLVLVCIHVVLAVALNVTVGCLGQIHLGHAGFMSLGAYAAGLFAKSGIMEPGIGEFLVGTVIACVVAVIVAIIVGIPALRLKGDYLAIITLAFGEIIRVLIEYFDFTGGAQGLSQIPRLSNPPFYLALTIVSIFIMFSVMTSRHGRVVLAIREDEIASDACGIDTTKAKVFAFALSACFAAVAGSMYAHHMGILSAKQFDYNYSINILVMVVLGGMGSFTGAIVSAIGLTVVPELLREFESYRMIVYSLALILIMIFRPQGLLGRKEFQVSKIIQYVTSRLGRNEVDHV